MRSATITYISQLSKEMMEARDGEGERRENSGDIVECALSRTVIFRVGKPGSDVTRRCSNHLGWFLSALSVVYCTKGTCTCPLAAEHKRCSP